MTTLLLMLMLFQVAPKPEVDPIRLDNGMGMKIYGCPTDYQGWHENYDPAERKFKWIKDAKSWVVDAKAEHHCLQIKLDPNVDVIKGMDRP